MSRIADTIAPHAVRVSGAPRLGLWTRLRRHIAELDNAHGRQANLMCLSDADVSDSGLSREDLMTESSYEPALPFFFQSGFGRR
ncbi:MAG: hypothetical protein ACK47C_15735 [Paracoccaceae bacterium]|jgi:uncharacterized protein YjiS (DUF1127 family)